MIDVRRLHRGDIVVVCDEEGVWTDAMEYVGPDDNEKAPGRILVRRRGEDQLWLWSVRCDFVAVPFVAVDGSEQPKSGEMELAVGAGGITSAQRKLMFALGRELGFDIDDLRALTPTASISALSSAEANRVIDALKGKPGWSGSRRSAQGTATSKQLGFIEYLRSQIDFTEESFSAWLARQFKVASLDEVRERGLASRIIGGLMEFQKNRHEAGETSRREAALGASP